MIDLERQRLTPVVATTMYRAICTSRSLSPVHAAASMECVVVAGASVNEETGRSTRAGARRRLEVAQHRGAEQRGKPKGDGDALR